MPDLQGPVETIRNKKKGQRLLLVGSGPDFVAELGVLLFQARQLGLHGLDVNTRGGAEVAPDVVHGICGPLGLLVQANEHLGQGVDHAGFFQVPSEFVLFGIVRIVVRARRTSRGVLVAGISLLFVAFFLFVREKRRKNDVV